MTENEIKEAISSSYLSTIVCRRGNKIQKISPDHGTDFLVLEVTRRTEPNGNLRIFDSGKQLWLQVKATTERGITRLEDRITFDLEAKTFNDLIARRNSSVPLYLILFVLPEDEHDWVCCDTEQVVIKKHAYWYLPEEDATETENTTSKRINIPLDQVIDLNTIPNLFVNLIP